MIESLPAGFTFRPVTDADACGLIGLIGACFSEYPGVYLEPEGLDSDLQAYASYMAEIGGEGYVLTDDAGIQACVSCAPVSGTAWQLKRIYLSERLRGTGLGLTLVQFIEGRARARGATSMELWSDTRFTRAHRFYAREGYVKQAETRDLHDSSNTTEFQFIKPL